MEKFLFFTDGDTVDAVGDVACYPLSSFLGFKVSNADNASLGMQFASTIGSGGTDGAAVDIVDLSINAATHKKVIASICKAINSATFADNGMVVIADQLNSVFCDSDIVACAITHDS